jgi:predicted amidohydrolase YtcJ
VENTLWAIEKALEDKPSKNNRHRVEHAHILDECLIERIEDSELVVSSQPERVYGSEAGFPDFLIVPLRSLGERGVRVAGGSDASTYARCTAGFPVNYSNPLTGICFEVSRKTRKGVAVQSEECVSVIEALKLHTLNGAYASFDEDFKGSLKEGKLADIVVLSHDPFMVDPWNIKDIKVERTIIGGRLVYSKD